MNFRKENKTEKYWEKNLSKKEFQILREGGTEQPYTGKYNNHFEDGVYVCKGCGKPLYKSKSKFDIGCGWPSFDECIKNSIGKRRKKEFFVEQYKYKEQCSSTTSTAYILTTTPCLLYTSDAADE